MELNDAELQLVKKHLRGKLTTAEAHAFAARLAADAAFAAEVDFHRKLFATLREQEHERLKKMLQDVESKNVTNRLPNRRWLLWLLAALTFGLCAWFLYARYHEKPKPAQLYAEYFKPYENTANVSTRSPETQAGAAWQAYDAGDYARAAELFEKLPATEQTDDTEFFNGVALLASGNAGKAASVLEQIEHATPQGKYAEQARWYLALACLQGGQPDKTRDLLARIIGQPAHFNHSKAIELNKKVFGRGD